MNMKIRKYKKAFTLVELIVVIAIVAVLASVVAVSYIAFITTANESSDIQKVEAINKLIKNDEILNEYEILNKDNLFETFHNHELTEENVKNNRSDSSLYFSINLQEVIYYVGSEIKFPANLEYFSINADDFYFNSTEYRGYIEVNYPEESSSNGGVQTSDPIAPPPIESSSEQPTTDDETIWDVSYEIPETIEPVEYNPGVKETITPVEPANHDGKTLFIDNAAEFLYVFNCSSWLLEDTYDEIKLRANLDLKFNQGYMNLDTFSNTNKLSTVHTIPLTINGNNKTIINLDNPNGSLIGLVKFKYVLEIKNVTFYNCNFGRNDCENNVGIVGKTDNGNSATLHEHSVTFTNVTIQNCNFTSATMNVAPYIGYLYQRCDVSINETNTTSGVNAVSPLCKASKLIGMLDTNSASETIDLNVNAGNGTTLVEPYGTVRDLYSDYSLRDGHDNTRNYSEYITNYKHSILTVNETTVNETKYLFISDSLFHILNRNKFTLRDELINKTFDLEVKAYSRTLRKTGKSNVTLANTSLSVNKAMFEGWEA